jgi:hypothetical protein
MSLPTTAIGFSPTTPAAPTGDQNTIPQGDNGTPLEKFSQYPKRATGTLFGTVKPDGTSITIAGGVISATSSGTWIQEVPSGTMNGVNKVFTLSFTPTASSLALILNIPQVKDTDFTIATNTITYTVAPKASDAGWHKAQYQH